MLQHGDEHGGNAMEAGDFFAVDAFQRLLGRKVRERRHGSAVGHGGRHCQDHAEAVEHRHLNHHAVSGGEIHAVPNVFTVVDDIIVAQHDAFGETRSAGSVLHVADVVLVQRAFAAIDFLDWYGFRQFNRLGPGQAARLFGVDGDDVAQERQTD